MAIEAQLAQGATSQQARPRLLAVAWAFFVRDLREALTYRASFVISLAAALFSLTTLFFFSRFIDPGRLPSLASYGGAYLPFALLGMVLLSLQHTAASAYPQQVRAAQLAGTLEAMLATPTPSWLVLLCSPVYRFGRALLSALTQCVLAWAFFGVSFANADLLMLAWVVPLALIAFSSLGFFSATATMVLRRSDPVGLAIGGLSTLAGGVFYPNAVLPGWLRTVGELLPITHALELLRSACFAPAPLSALWRPTLGLMLFATVAAPAGLAAFVWAVRRARRDGSLNHY
jgi:ABC-type multidrug transport system permease subunit